MRKNNKRIGVVDVWFDHRGFGFIKENQDGKLFKLFLHISQILSGTPQAGALAFFNEGSNGKGPAATDVEIIAPGKPTIDALQGDSEAGLSVLAGNEPEEGSDNGVQQ